MEQVHEVSDFDNLVVQVVEETLNYCLGEVNAMVIHNYMNERNLPFNEITDKPELFSEELRKILGFGSRQILCAASVLEDAIIDLLCKKLKITLDYKKPVNFPFQITKVREKYLNGENRR